MRRGERGRTSDRGFLNKQAVTQLLKSIAGRSSLDEDLPHNSLGREEILRWALLTAYPEHWQVILDGKVSTNPWHYIPLIYSRRFTKAFWGERSGCCWLLPSPARPTGREPRTGGGARARPAPIGAARFGG
jgi:hypothetical protein